MNLNTAPVSTTIPLLHPLLYIIVRVCHSAEGLHFGAFHLLLQWHVLFYYIEGK